MFIHDVEDVPPCLALICFHVCPPPLNQDHGEGRHCQRKHLLMECDQMSDIWALLLRGWGEAGYRGLIPV